MKNPKEYFKRQRDAYYEDLGYQKGLRDGQKKYWEHFKAMEKLMMQMAVKLKKQIRRE